MAEVPEHLLLIHPEQAQLYCPGRHLSCTADPTDLTVGYRPEDIIITRVADPERDSRGKPALSKKMDNIWEARYESFNLAERRNGEMPGMRIPRTTDGKLNLQIFNSSYYDYMTTIPKGDEHDGKLVLGEMLTYINIHHVPITVDGHMLYVERHPGRDSHHGKLLCTHSWGEDNDKNYAHAAIMDKLTIGQGAELFAQARDGLRRELNPWASSGSPDVANTVLEEVLGVDDVEILNANCLTAHALTGDTGFHIGFTAAVKKEAGEILERVNNYEQPNGSRILGVYAVPFTADSMKKFFAEKEERMTTSVEAAIIMACVQQFGEEFLCELPFEARRQLTVNLGERKGF